MNFNLNSDLRPGFIFLVISVSTTFASVQIEPGLKILRTLSIHPDTITLSGFSSGGTFAQQLQISYSSRFSGIAVINHAYYRCGPGDGLVDNYDNACTILANPRVRNLYNPENATQDIRRYYRQGLIENPANLRNKKLYVYTGTKNSVFSTDLSFQILDVYEPLIQNLDAIRTRVQPANLVLPSDNFGGPCGAEAPPENAFVANCGLSAPFDALHFLLGSNVVQALHRRRRQVQLQPLQAFDQTEFVEGIQGRHDMDAIGFIYVPKRCTQTVCYLHFYFHGCGSGREFVGINHIRHSGYLEIGEENGIIMVFPQALASAANPSGCWDTYGVTGRFYATQLGAQVIAVQNMLKRIMG